MIYSTMGTHPKIVNADIPKLHLSRNSIPPVNYTTHYYVEKF
jgi:hypothetical protein